MPGCLLAHWRPIGSIGGTPDILKCFIFREIISAADQPDLVLENHSLMKSTGSPRGAFDRQLPVATIAAAPNIILSITSFALVIILQPSENPDFVAEAHCG
jgi:hypothetical protein